MGPALRAITPDAEQQIDSLVDEEVDGDVGILGTALRPQDGSPLVVNALDEARRQAHRRDSIFGVQPSKSIADAEHLGMLMAGRAAA